MYLFQLKYELVCTNKILMCLVPGMSNPAVIVSISRRPCTYDTDYNTCIFDPKRCRDQSLQPCRRAHIRLQPHGNGRCSMLRTNPCIILFLSVSQRKYISRNSPIPPWLLCLRCSAVASCSISSLTRHSRPGLLRQDH